MDAIDLTFLVGLQRVHLNSVPLDYLAYCASSKFSVAASFQAMPRLRTKNVPDAEVRQRLLLEKEESNIKWDPNDLPPQAKLRLARKAPQDPKYVFVLEVLMVIFTILGGVYCLFYFDNVHFHVTHAYAHLGYDSAQHQVGQRYLHGKGIEKHPEKAMEWFRKAADQGHPHAAYNLAVGHLKGYRTDLKPGESHRLITHAAAHGVREAHHVLNSVCTKGGCY